MSTPLMVEVLQLDRDLRAMRAENERLLKEAADYMQRIEASRSENWRLREQRDGVLKQRDKAVRILEDKLAAANGLLERVRTVVERHRNHLPGTRCCWLWTQFNEALAGQPAAPTQAAGCDYPASWCAFPGCYKCFSTHPRRARTEAEQAVLDELSGIPVQALQYWREYGTILQSNVAVVELARRGLR